MNQSIVSSSIAVSRRFNQIKSNCLRAFALLLLLAIPASSVANTAITGITGGSLFVFNNQGFTVGYEFTVSQAITVENLGFYDAGGDGLATTHPVGLFNLCGTLLASNTVAAGTSAPLTNGFRYVSITPIVLGPGTYRVGAVVFNGGGNDAFYQGVATLGTDPIITYVRGKINNGLAILQYPFQDATATGLQEKSSFGANFTFTVGGTPPGAPEVNLKGNGIDIADGSTNASLANGTDFGAVPITGGSVTNTFTIENLGTEVLNLSGTPKVTITGANANNFTVLVQPATSTVATNSSVTFTIVFDPSAIGIRTATMSFASDDCDENPYDVALKGTGATFPPTVNVPASPVIVEATSASGAVATFSVTATDPEDGALTPVVTPASGSTFPLGTNTVTASATDSGGLSVTNTFLVIVRDTTAPVISAHGNVTAEATSASGAVVTYTNAVATDAVGVTNLAYSQISGTLFPIGTTTVIVSATDAAGNVGTNSFTVTVQVSPPPALYVTGNASLVTVFWQHVPGWSLQENSDLLLPGDWTDNTNAVLSGGTNYLMLTNAPGHEFYRLTHP